jgi:hypothetical protein
MKWAGHIARRITYIYYGRIIFVRKPDRNLPTVLFWDVTPCGSLGRGRNRRMDMMKSEVDETVWPGSSGGLCNYQILKENKAK